MMDILGMLIRLILFGLLWMIVVLGIGTLLGFAVACAVRAYYFLNGD